MKSIYKITLSVLVVAVFSFTKLYAQPGGVTCAAADAAQLTLPFYQAGLSNCGTNNFTSANTPVCGNSSYLSGQDRVYAFTALESGFVITTLTTASPAAAGIDIGLMMFRDCPTLGQCVGNSNGVGRTRIMQGEVVAGQTYYILVSTWATPNCISNYSLRVSVPGGALQGTPKVDCIAATPICATSYTENTVATTEGFAPFDDEINEDESCMLAGERKGYWYSFTVTTAGTFEFVIDPNVNSTDYDWTLFDITSYTCADIFNIPSLEVRCNWSGVTGNTGISSTITGSQWEPAINVATARNYMLYVSNYTQSANGYVIYLQGTAGYIDTEGPNFKSIEPVSCGDDNIVVNFTEPVLCTAMDVGQFILKGPGVTTYSIIQTYGSPNCIGANANTSVLNYRVKFVPPITTPGVYTFTSQPTTVMVDRCGNTNLVNPQPTPIVTFSISPLVANATVVSSITCNGFSNGVATSIVPSSIISYTYLWSTIPAKTTKAVSALAAGTYSVVVTSPTGCSAAPVSVVVNEPAAVPKPTIPKRVFTYCQNTFPPALVATFTGPGVGQVRWYTARVGGGPPSLVAPTPSTLVVGQKKYYVSQFFAGCEGIRDSIIVDVVAWDKPFYDYNPREYCLTGTTSPTPVFHATATLGGTFTSDAALNINPSTGQINLATSAVGPHVVKYTTGGLCPRDSSITITIMPPPNPDFDYPLSEFCPGDVSLEKVLPSRLNDVGVFTSSPAGVVFDGASGAINLKTTPASPIGYVITNTIAPSKGCAQEAHGVPLDVKPLPKIDIESDKYEDCHPFTTNFKAVTNTTDGTYLWSFGNGDSSNVAETAYAFKDTGSHVVKLVYGKPGCSSVVTKTFVSYELPIAKFSTNPEPGMVGSPQNFVDESQKSVSWIWSFGDGTFSDEQEPSHIYANDGEFEIVQIVTSVNACKDTVAYKLVVENLISAYYPKSFTPNGDGLNDFFEVKVNGINPNPGSFELEVYNRWGIRVYHSTDYATHRWDGGASQSDNLYIIKLKVQDKEGTFYNYRGTITVLR